jgi:hypothetical protein
MAIFCGFFEFLWIIFNQIDVAIFAQLPVVIKSLATDAGAASGKPRLSVGAQTHPGFVSVSGGAARFWWGHLRARPFFFAVYFHGQSDAGEVLIDKGGAVCLRGVSARSWPFAAAPNIAFMFVIGAYCTHSAEATSPAPSVRWCTKDFKPRFLWSTVIDGDTQFPCNDWRNSFPATAHILANSSCQKHRNRHGGGSGPLGCRGMVNQDSRFAAEAEKAHYGLQVAYYSDDADWPIPNPQPVSTKGTLPTCVHWFGSR